MYRLFDKWKELEVTHSLTVLFFSRTYLHSKHGQNTCADSISEPRKNNLSAEQKDVDGRLYEDHFKVVIENETNADWSSLVHKIKKEFLAYPAEVGWTLSSEICKVPSTAAQGNILEAINTTLNLLQLHYMDRDLHRSGNSVVIVSAGSGVFEVDKNLAGITKQRMMDNGIGSDMLSLGLPPLHVAPFFLYKELSSPHDDEAHGFDDWKTYFEIPHWMHLSFVSYDQKKRSTTVNDTIFGQAKDIYFDQTQRHPNGLILHNEALPRNVKTSNHNLQDSQRTFVSCNSSLHSLDMAHDQQRDLISGRDFEEILQACRPRNRGESMGGMPSALIFMIKNLAIAKSFIKPNGFSNKLSREKCEKSEVGDKNKKNIQSLVESSLSSLDLKTSSDSTFMAEWGSVNFDVINKKKLRSGSMASDGAISSSSNNMWLSDKLQSNLDQGCGSDKSSPSSSFASHYSYLLGRSPGSYFKNSPLLTGIQIQQSSSNEIPLFNLDNSVERYRSARIGSEDSLSSMGCTEESPKRLNSLNESESSSYLSNTTQKKIKSVESLRKSMFQYDSNVFAFKQNSQHEARNSLKDTPSTRLMVPRRHGVDFGSNGNSQTQQHHVGGIGALLGQVGNQVKGSSNMRVVHGGTFKRPHIMAYEGKLAYFQGKELGDRGYDLASNTFVSSNHQNPASNFYVGSMNSDTSRLNHKQKSRSPEKEKGSKILKIGNKKNKKRNKKILKILHTQNSRKLPNNTHLPSRRKPWVLNPFRQQDEEEVLAKRTHNRRRWSHVFPQGEAEFKRHAGPNWKSLCQPAILPITIDFHPSQQELNDQNKYEFGYYKITLDAMDKSYYKTHSELLVEMVRQRLIQDFQLVPQSVLMASTMRKDSDRRDRKVTPSISNTNHLSMMNLRAKQINPIPRSSGPIQQPRLPATNRNNTTRYALSMGHRIQVLSYDPTSDAVEVEKYQAKFARNHEINKYAYNYMLWLPTTKSFEKVTQEFQRFPQEYPWNTIDNLICGDEDKVLSDNSRFRRINFRIIPDEFNDLSGEHNYVIKFKKLLEYIEKLVQADSKITIVTSTKKEEANGDILSGTITRKYDQFRSSFKRFVVPLRRGRNEKYEWMEIHLDSIFNTKKTYRIMLHWLVASAIKVEAQVQLLQRRCSQYGLRLISFPQVSLSSNQFLNPFSRPQVVTIKNRNDSKIIVSALLGNFSFINDGSYVVSSSDFQDSFNFRQLSSHKRSRRFLAQQFAHRSGTILIRSLEDDIGSTLFIFLENRRLIGMDSKLMQIARDIFAKVTMFMTTLNRSS